MSINPGEQTFTNRYEATGQWTPTATKTLSGRALVDGEFAFELRDAEGGLVQTATNDAEGKVAFDAIEYTEADAGKTFTYTIAEAEGERGGVAYDTGVRTVTVTVTDNGDGTLSVSETVKLGDAIADAVAFINTYTSRDSAAFQVTKTLVGRDLEAGQFTFELRDAEGTLLSTATNDADGVVAFEPIGYTQADAGKTFTYTVTEKNDGQTGYTYDSHSVAVTVTITDDGEGGLTAEVSYDGETTFTNTYVPEKTPSPTPTPSVNPLVQTGGVVGTGLVAAGLLTAAGLLLRRRRTA